jgi:hypothetical protein
MTKPKLYYAHITRTHTHCYINCQSSHANPFFFFFFFFREARAGCAPAWIRAWPVVSVSK